MTEEARAGDSLGVDRGEDFPKTANVDPHAPVRGENPTPKHPAGDAAAAQREEAEQALRVERGESP